MKGSPSIRFMSSHNISVPPYSITLELFSWVLVIYAVIHISSSIKMDLFVLAYNIHCMEVSKIKSMCQKNDLFFPAGYLSLSQGRKDNFPGRVRNNCYPKFTKLLCNETEGRRSTETQKTNFLGILPQMKKFCPISSNRFKGISRDKMIFATTWLSRLLSAA